MGKENSLAKNLLLKGSREKRALRLVRGLATRGESALLDQMIHEKVRLAIVSALAVNPSLSFNDLKKLLDVTDGNLSVHARRLEDAGYIRCTKSFEGRVPKTEYRLAEIGRQALDRYLDHMESLIQAMKDR